MKLIQPNYKVEKLKANLFFAGILAIIIIVLWIGMSVYQAYSTSEPDKSIEKLLAPINPTLDSEALEQFKNSRIKPNDTFQIIISTEENGTQNTYILNPFTNTTTTNTASSSTLPTLSTTSTTINE